MICPICKKDISEPIEQFGDPHHAICQSCYLADFEWVQDDPEILDYLGSGMSLDNAILIVNKNHIKDLMEEFFEDVNIVKVHTVSQ